MKKTFTALLLGSACFTAQALNQQQSAIRTVAAHLGSGYSAGDRYPRTNWVQWFGQQAQQGERQGVPGYHDAVWGLALGGDDGIFGTDVQVGLAGSWSNADVHHEGLLDTSSNIDSYQVMLYGQVPFAELAFFNWIFAAAFNQYIIQFPLQLGTTQYTIVGNTHGGQYGLKGECGYDFVQNYFHIIPLISLFYSHLDISSYTNNANMNIDAKHLSLLEGGLGIRFAFDCIVNAIAFQPEWHVMVFYDVVNEKMQTTAQFTANGPNFATDIAPAPANYNLGFSIRSENYGGFDLLASYDFDYKEQYTANAGFFKLRYIW